jgi:tRNA (cytidine/uridine-2'-O-)-methyltransferase
MRIALYQADIPQNTGTILRLGACMGVPIDIIEPASFDMSDRALKRAALDYAEAAQIARHGSFLAFKRSARESGSRIVLVTTKSDVHYHAIVYRASDILLFGRESAGVPEDVHDAAGIRVRIPMSRDMRSLNVAVAAAMVLGEALRQTGGYSRFA